MCYYHSRSKLKIKGIAGPIADSDVKVHDDICIANIINDYFSSVATNNKLPIPEPVHVFHG